MRVWDEPHEVVAECVFRVERDHLARCRIHGGLVDEEYLVEAKELGWQPRCTAFSEPDQ